GDLGTGDTRPDPRRAERRHLHLQRPAPHRVRKPRPVPGLPRPRPRRPRPRLLRANETCKQRNSNSGVVMELNNLRVLVTGATAGIPLTDQTALVTGASRGIGRYTAQRLARDGARGGVHYGTNEASPKDAVGAIEAAGGSAFLVQADLAEPHAAEALWAAFDEHADSADILVNNAGVVVYGHVNEVAEEDFERLFAVNVKAVLFIIQHGLHRLRDGARIINLSSAGAYMASPMATMYTMTKGAISTL